MLSAAFGVEQIPVLVLQVPAVRHCPDAEQETGLLPVQVPFWQVSVCVQAFPSLQLVPSVAAIQVPVDAEQGMQVPHAEPLLCQAPVPSQVCGCWPEHR